MSDSPGPVRGLRRVMSWWARINWKSRVTAILLLSTTAAGLVLWVQLAVPGAARYPIAGGTFCVYALVHSVWAIRSAHRARVAAVAAATARVAGRRFKTPPPVLPPLPFRGRDERR